MVNALNIIYTPSESVISQGENVRKQKKKGYYEKYGGNGTYRMVKPSNAILEFEVEGNTHSCSVKELIRNAYSISRVSEKHALRFLHDVQEGNINLSYVEGRGLKLM